LTKAHPHNTQDHSATNYPKHSSRTSSSTTGNQKRPSHPRPTLPKTKKKVPTSTRNHRSHSQAPPNSPTHNSSSASRKSPPTTGKTTPPRPPVSKTREKVPTPTRNTITDRSRSGAPPSPPTRTSFPASKKPPVATTATNSTITRAPPLTASRTVTVSHGKTASAQVGWMVVGAGIGGAVSVGGKIIPVGGGVAGIVEPNGPGGEELSTVHTTSTASSTSSSPSGTPTQYNIYPRPGSTAAQLLAFERNLNQIAQPGSVTSITGARNRLVLWTAKLTPVQASELHQNPAVSSASGVENAEYSSTHQLLFRSGV
jgi:hypothetical protein